MRETGHFPGFGKFHPERYEIFRTFYKNAAMMFLILKLIDLLDNLELMLLHYIAI